MRLFFIYPYLKIWAAEIWTVETKKAIHPFECIAFFEIDIAYLAESESA